VKPIHFRYSTRERRMTTRRSKPPSILITARSGANVRLIKISLQWAWLEESAI
jgi:hypothetical protein